MKRKVIKQGHNTLTITLPSKWVKDNNIEAGQELNYTVEGDSLIISQDGKKNVSSFVLNTHEEGIILNREIGSLFKKGYDEIKIISQDPKLLAEVQEIIGYSLVGFEVLCQSKDMCTVKQVAETQENEFDSILSRTLFQLEVMAEGFYDAMKTADIDAIPNLKSMEINNNRYTTFLRRVLNKGLYPDKRNERLMYTLVEFVEKIADEYKYLAIYLLESDNNIKKIPAEILDIYKEIHKLLCFTTRSYYKFNQKELHNSFQRRKLLIKRTINFIVTHNKRDCLVGHYALALIQEIADVWSLILTMSH